MLVLGRASAGGSGVGPGDRERDGETERRREMLERKIIISLASGKMEKAETISSTPGEQVDPNQTGQ